MQVSVYIYRSKGHLLGIKIVAGIYGYFPAFCYLQIAEERQRVRDGQRIAVGKMAVLFVDIQRIIHIQAPVIIELREPVQVANELFRPECRVTYIIHSLTKTRNCIRAGDRKFNAPSSGS